MKVILLEFVDEAKILLRKYGKEFFLSKDVIILPLYPKVRAFLKQNGISSKDSLDYLDTDAQHRIMLKNNDLVNQLMNNIHLIDRFGIEKGYQEMVDHYLRVYINHFLWAIQILTGLKQKHALEEIYCCLPKDANNMYTSKAYFSKQERFIGFLARDFCRVHKINFCGTVINTGKFNLFNFWLTKLIGKIGELFSFIEYRLAISKRFLKLKTVVVPATSYNMGNILKKLKKNHPDLRCLMVWEGKHTLRQELSKIRLIVTNWLKKVKKENIIDAYISLELITKRFKKDAIQQENISREFDNLTTLIRSEFKDLLNFQATPFSFYLAEKVSKGLKQELLSIQHMTMFLYSFFQDINPKLLMAMYSRGIYYTMGDLSRHLGFNSLNISHGTHVPPNNKFEEIENLELGKSVILNTYEYVTVQTPWADKFLNYYKDNRPRVVCGPLLYSKKDNDLGKLRRSLILGKKDNCKIIVYATTQKGRGKRFHINETADEWISSLIDIVNAVNKLDNTYLILRPHPICDISQEEFRVLLPSCPRLFIINKGAFSPILSMANLLISYSSTCIEEALQERIPVLLYDKWRRYNHFNINETAQISSIGRNPAYYITNPGILSSSIYKIFDVFDNDPLKDQDLGDYKYPAEYKKRFFEFVNQCLQSESSQRKGRQTHECCSYPG
jgi:hypothetical protein